MLANLCAWLEPLGYRPDCARDGASGLEMALAGNWSCIVLDVMLPRLDGCSLCARLREAGCDTPIIMLTARDTVEDRVFGLDAGADDYLVKPFSLRELEARIRALIRRREGVGGEITIGPLVIRPAEGRAWRDGEELRLAPGPFQILLRLARRHPALVSRAELEEMLWDEPREGSALRNHIHELRKILDRPFQKPMLETAPHAGWRLRNGA